LRRTDMMMFFQKLPPTSVALEACGASHHLAQPISA
jgi:transposase